MLSTRKDPQASSDLCIHLNYWDCISEYRSLFPIYRWWHTSAVNHRLKFLKLLLSWGTNIPSKNLNDERLQLIDSVCICLFCAFAAPDQHQLRVSSPLHELHLKRLKPCQKDFKSVMRVEEWCTNFQVQNFLMIHHDSETFDHANSKYMWQTKLAKS